MRTIILGEVKDYIAGLPKKHQDKVDDMMRLLERGNGKLDSRYSKPLRDKIRELIVSFDGSEHRVLFILLPDAVILHLTAFCKKTRKTPSNRIERAINLKNAYLNLFKHKK